MSSDKIQLVNKHLIAETSLNTKILQQIHSDLNIQKTCIFIFISDEEMLDLNKKALNHDYYTDIITFDYEADDDIEENEIVISYDRVKENAELHHKTYSNEMSRVCIHGMLHLSGQNDKTKEDQKKMTSLEDHYLNLYCST